MSKASKGAMIERKAIHYLISKGYIIHRTVRSGGYTNASGEYGVSSDVFHCIDIIAIHPKEKRIRWIQVTAHSGIGEKKRKMGFVPWNTKRDSVEIWRWVGGRRTKTKPWTQGFWVYHLDDEYKLIKDTDHWIDIKNNLP